MPNGGNLSISLERHDGDSVITISDTGIGMTEEQMARLGTPFYSAKEKGTGLGTMVAFSIIQAMDGNIHVKSEKDIGTTFTITFPLGIGFE
ncbi:MAG: ATP-binding protein [Bacillaceae bacterium]|nr:ATP-binding protein [Bacillaceae bacterium]